ncbi:PLDc N-terminal domain-containing protein [Pseudonocardia sp.]|jgi:hypothetical protein|uniref:PLDc N-terminal domain-containing protein n=1 Tax=Pseudonocardia sp. TaxID=60912 RepID=UPI002610DE45|nr:PLDc N-terminal domain-containing protein [Pseudonocardia sp.]MCW2719518.1 hypothetical protein [Pseudonocardia sp.]
MSPKRRWSDLTERQRRLLVAAGVVEAGLKCAALRDLRRRPEGQLRGPKWVWAVAVLVVNTLGSLAYFTLARRPEQPSRLASESYRP